MISSLLTAFSTSRRTSTARPAIAALFTILALSTAPLNAQAPSNSPTAQPPADSQTNTGTTTISVRSNLVLVPALVTTKSGEVVFELTADDFLLTDNGAPQKLRMEADNDAQPIAIVLLLQNGNTGASHLNDYGGLTEVLDSVIGNVPYRIAVVSFDSTPRIAQDFTADKSAAVRTVARLSGGDDGAAILDALSFSIDLLRKQPVTYRRVLFLFSQTLDSGSQSTFQSALRAVDDTNTSIYSFGFPGGGGFKHEASKAPGGHYSNQPYAPGGCMSRQPNADPDAHGNRGVQAYDCVEDLLPPLRLTRLAYLAVRDEFKRNIPESVAQLTGGEYFPLKNAKTLSKDLLHISNDVPNHYVLSFSPQPPDPGFHVLDLKLKDRPNLEIRARNAYWIDAEPTAAPPPATNPTETPARN